MGRVFTLYVRWIRLDPRVFAGCRAGDNLFPDRGVRSNHLLLAGRIPVEIVLELHDRTINRPLVRLACPFLRVDYRYLAVPLLVFENVLE